MKIRDNITFLLSNASFSSTLWLLGERIFKMALGFLMFALIARHLGPENFGILNYAIAFVTLAISFTSLGLSGLLVKDLVNHPQDRDKLLGSALTMRFVAGIVALLIITTFLYVTEDNIIARTVLIIISLRLVLDCLEVIDLFFQSIVKSKFTAISKIIALIVIFLVNMTLVYMNVSIIGFAVIVVIEFVIIYCLLFAFYIWNFGSPLRWRFNFTLSKKLLKRSWPLIISGVAAMIYLKSDQIMLRWLDSDSAVGIYSSAVRLSEVWFFVPVAIVTSQFPSIINAKKQGIEHYNKKLQDIYTLLFYMALSLAIIVMFIGSPLINIAYGSEYSDGSTILKIHIWTAVFVFLRALLSKWLINEDLYIFSLVSHGLGAIANIFLNLWLIPIYGGIGAAVGTFLSFSISTLLFTFLSKKTRAAGIMMIRAILDPVFRLIGLMKK
ncbi:flippase [Geomicrobium sp. JSM 1781026]|uniref:flippase n=1 Tax=Geomicrobium sp. JSM 1781026 TaxID=3344580 RepID=UPI0035C004E5